MTLLEQYISSLPPSDSTAIAVRDYFEWQSYHRDTDFIPGDDDDVYLRTYLLYLRANGVEQATLKKRVAELKRFYKWVKTERVITFNPFDEYKYDRPFLTSEQIRPRQRALPSNRLKREVEILRAHSQIAERLNKSLDIQNALVGALETLLKVLDLQTGWVSMLTESHLSIYSSEDSSSLSFTLAAACGLPPGLEFEDRRFLRQPPVCHCQRLLLEGRLLRAVNIVECERLRNAAQASGDNRGLLFHASVPLISRGKPLGVLNVATTEWQFLSAEDLRFLSSVAEQVAVTLERAYLFEIAEAQRSRIEHELQVAREVQVSLMPRQMPHIPGFSFAATWQPAHQVAGDFYNIFPLPEGRWGIVIGDVTDKGAPAALYMAMTQSLILSSALRHQSPSAVLTDVNRTMLTLSSSGMFVSVFLAVLDPEKHTLRYANAGHNPPIVRRASGKIESLIQTGSVIGVLEDPQLSESTFNLEHGDVVVLYTDGVTEAWHPRSGEYGIDRLIAAITAAPEGASELLSQVEADFNTFTKGAPHSDDVAFFVLSRD